MGAGPVAGEQREKSLTPREDQTLTNQLKTWPRIFSCSQYGACTLIYRGFGFAGLL
jgi:hypothetical protein